MEPNPSAIQEAIHAAESAGGGDVLMPRGVIPFRPGDRLVIRGSRIHLRGAGMGQTVLRLDPRSTADMDASRDLIRVEGWKGSGGSVEHVFFSDFSIDGRRYVQEYSTDRTAAINAFCVRHGGMRRVHVKRWHSEPSPGKEPVCLHFVDSHYSHIEVCHTSDSPNVQGARISGQRVGGSKHCTIRDHSAESMETGMVLWQAKQCSVLGGHSKDSTKDGVDCEDGRGCTIGEVMVERAGAAGIRSSESYQTLIRGNNILSSNQNGAEPGEANTAGVTLCGKDSDGGGSQVCFVDGNLIYDDQGANATQMYGIEEREDARNNRIGNNLIAYSVMAPYSVGPTTEVP